MFDQANHSNFGIYLNVLKFDLCLSLDSLIVYYTNTKSFSLLPTTTSFSYYWPTFLSLVWLGAFHMLSHNFKSPIEVCFYYKMDFGMNMNKG